MALLCLHAGDPAGCALAGLLRTAAQEMPKLRPSLLSIAASETGPSVVSEVLGLLASAVPAGSELRHGRSGPERRIWRELADLPQGHLPEGPWLVTGGAGGVGIALARALAKPGMGFMLLGRSAHSARIETALAALQSAGAKALYRSADVADEGALAAALAEMRREIGAPVAVFHAAGVIRDALIRNKRDSDIDAVFAPKLHGVEALDRVTKNDPLELFALCSSLAAVTGNAGQSDYAFANRFLDAFAEARIGPGRSLSINWPFWREGGMRLGAAAEAGMARLGLTPLDTAPAIEALRQAVACNSPVVAVAAGEPSAVRRLFDAAPPKAADEAAARPTAITPHDVAPAAPMEVLLPQLASLVGEVLGVEAHEVEPEEYFLEYGFDSVSLATLAARVSDTFGLDLQPARFFEMPSLAALAQHLLAEHADALKDHLPAVPPPAQQAAP
ncbi:MAG: beta-ketoacyl reductase, partial [Pseudomonadota bacterium]